METNQTTTPEQKCAAQHFGKWMIEPAWFAQAVEAVKAGTFSARDPEARRGDSEGSGRPYAVHNGIAIVPIVGQITKGQSSYGGTSSIATRKAIRQAASDADVSGIMLHIDSPGGTVAGLADLASDVRAAAGIKPTRAHIDDLGASAAYWVASQTSGITANETALVGSIGTVAVVHDSSGAADKAGIKVHVVSTGAHKGAFAPGTEVTEEQIAELQTEVNDLNEHFLQAVQDGRQMTRTRLEAIADGRVFIAAKALGHGLIDAVTSFDAAITSFSKELDMEAAEQFQKFAAENPQAVMDLSAVKTALSEQYDQGHQDGKADGVKAEKDRVAGILALGADPVFTLEQIKSDAKPEAAKDAMFEALKAENQKLKASSGSQGEVAMSEDTLPPDPNDPAAAWDNDKSLQARFPDKDRYVALKSGTFAATI